MFYSKERLSKPSPVDYNIQSTSFRDKYHNNITHRRVSSDLQETSPIDKKSLIRPKSSSFGAARASYEKVVSQNGFNY